MTDILVRQPGNGQECPLYELLVRRSKMQAQLHQCSFTHLGGSDSQRSSSQPRHRVKGLPLLESTAKPVIIHSPRRFRPAMLYPSATPPGQGLALVEPVLGEPFVFGGEGGGASFEWAEQRSLHGAQIGRPVAVGRGFHV